MSDTPRDPIADYFADTDKLTRVMGEAVRDALRTHKLLGHSIVTCRDGGVVVLPPEEIPLNGDTTGDR